MTFQSLTDFEYTKINKYTIQGFIYGLLKDTEFSTYHDIKGFKFFNFSNIFPLNDFNKEQAKKIIISSPNKRFIKSLHNSLKKIDSFSLSNYKMLIKNLKLFNSENNSKFISSTPIVLFQDNQSNTYFSFEKNPDFEFFFNRLKNNALKKYNAYYNDEFYMDGALFDSFEFSREVSVRIVKNENKFIIIGSLWKYLEKSNNDYVKFYKFLLDCGLGEKNSLGFGMINNLR
ncbi:MAG: CRISPR-associated endoribonuclease Cas6 [Methanobrevibacter sp.]|jgi:CRISPR-associated endoribonuclease Cas6|nr:CRISPR-associated endoribonuclease Cas6 [Candidatus Methanovirga meridionalis]